MFRKAGMSKLFSGDYHFPYLDILLAEKIDSSSTWLPFLFSPKQRKSFLPFNSGQKIFGWACFCGVVDSLFFNMIYCLVVDSLFFSMIYCLSFHYHVSYGSLSLGCICTIKESCTLNYFFPWERPAFLSFSWKIKIFYTEKNQFIFRKCIVSNN